METKDLTKQILELNGLQNHIRIIHRTLTEEIDLTDTEFTRDYIHESLTDLQENMIRIIKDIQN